MKLEVHRRDYDCSDNRLLDHIEKYLNEYSSKDLFYGQVKSVTNYAKRGYVVKVNEYIKMGDCITNEPIDYLIGSREYVNEILRTFKIKEVVRKIKTKK